MTSCVLYRNGKANSQGQDGGARAYLNSFIQESDDAIEQAKAKELLQKLNDYKTDASLKLADFLFDQADIIHIYEDATQHGEETGVFR